MNSKSLPLTAAILVFGLLAYSYLNRPVAVPTPALHEPPKTAVAQPAAPPSPPPKSKKDADAELDRLAADLAFEAAVKAEPEPWQDPKPAPAPEPGKIWVDASYFVTEKNSSWWRFAWKAKVENATSSVKKLRLYIKLTDPDGYIVDEDSSSAVFVLAPGGILELSGYQLVNVEPALRISQIKAELRQFP